MTKEEMSEKINEYCNHTSCIDCPMYKIDEIGRGEENCYTLDGDLPINIERNYAVLFGDGTYEKTANDSNDVVNHPSHYTQGNIECIDAMKSAFGADELAVYCKIAAFKYIWRCEHKNGLEDIKKAVWYLEKYIELVSELSEGETSNEV